MEIKRRSRRVKGGRRVDEGLLETYHFRGRESSGTGMVSVRLLLRFG